MERGLSPSIRRKKILKLLKEKKATITGSSLAETFQVSRQVIVQDIALLRARGERIIATPQGYLIPGSRGHNLIQRTLACRHSLDGVKRELQIMINHGARVLDVIVEHPIYGELRGVLMLQTGEDVENFLASLNREEARLLSSLTEGVHLHTVEMPNQESFQRLKRVLGDEGLLVD